jgi:iron complex outermembrane receptor protein
MVHDVLLRGSNLTDELARSHVSALKDVAPLPGRDLSLSYRLTF